MTMSWQDAILHVLGDAGEPLNYNEITERIRDGNLREMTGATPQTTVNRQLGIMIAEDKVVLTGRGEYALPDMAKQVEAEEAAEEKARDDAAVDPDKLTVKAYGMYWDRSVVDWSPVRGQLWGQQNDEAIPVNFADQDGIYLLHSWNEIVYVGQTFTAKGESGLYGRLRSHHTDRDRRKSDRWDAFSWFGFKPVDEGAVLLDAPASGDLGSIIDVIESMFIEAFMPRLNMQTGRGSKALREIGLYYQSSLQRVSRGFR